METPLLFASLHDDLLSASTPSQKRQDLRATQAATEVHRGDPLFDAIEELGEVLLAQLAQIHIQKAYMSAQRSTTEENLLYLAAQLRALQRTLQ
jgi:hypothetical protein